jgi:hypothetical protein
VQAALVLMAELGAHGVAPRFREPAWTMTLAFTGWKAPDLDPPGDFLVADGRSWAAPEAIRYRDRHYTVWAADGNLGVLCFATPHDRLAWDAQGHPGYWQGRQPITVELWNGTGQTQAVSFLAEGLPGPSNPDLSKRTVCYALGECRGEQALGAANGWRLSAPLTLPPGRSRLALSVKEPATVPLAPNDPRDLLLLLTDFRLGPAPDNYSPGAAEPAVPSPLMQE